MNIQLNHEFIARGKAIRDDIAVPALIVGSYSTLGTEPVQCKVELEKNWPSDSDPHYGHQNSIQLRGRTLDGKDIWVPTFQLTRQSFRSNSEEPLQLEGIAELFIEGDLNEFGASKAVISCVVSISPTPIAITNSDHTRTIAAEGLLAARARYVR